MKLAEVLKDSLPSYETKEEKRLAVRAARRNRDQIARRLFLSQSSDDRMALKQANIVFSKTMEALCEEKS